MKKDAFRTGNPDLHFARVMVEELEKQDLLDVMVCSGSRSTPLVYALWESEEIQTYVHLDERSAGYFALGYGRATGRPMPIISTSGTAVANFHPAVVEADRSEVPMMILSSDRPPELRDSGANQTVDQMKMFGDDVRWFTQLPEAEFRHRKIRSLRVKVFQALQHSSFPSPGPVHVNVPFRKPFEPECTEGSNHGSNGVDSNEQGEKTLEPGSVRWERGGIELSGNSKSVFPNLLEASERPLIVAGPNQGTNGTVEEIYDFASEFDVPVMADPLSGLRYRSGKPPELILGSYDAWTFDEREQPVRSPDLVVRTGGAPTSKSLRKWLKTLDVRQVMIHPSSRWNEAEFTATDVLQSNPARCFREALRRESFNFDRSWTESVIHVERTARTMYDELLPDSSLEGSYVRMVLKEVPSDAGVFVSNSMPVRDLDRFVPQGNKHVPVYGNRGASGIDGIVSTALGTALDPGRRPVLITGDLALYHDMNGLAAVNRWDLNPVIIVLDNRGGGIFHKLPISDFDPPFTNHFRTPHEVNFSGIESTYNIPVHTSSGIEQFRSDLRSALSKSTPSMIQVPTDAEASMERREELEETLRSRLEDSAPQ